MNLVPRVLPLPARECGGKTLGMRLVDYKPAAHSSEPTTLLKPA